MKVLILGGFLGSGKTTILLQLAKYIIGDNADDSAMVVIIENEIGEVGVDNVLLESGGLQVQNMFAGCVCCTLAGELVPTIRQIKDEYNPELVILEATGVACPASIAEMINSGTTDVPVRICTIVDAKRWPRIRPAIGNLIEDQLLDASTVLVNKIDLVSENEADDVAAEILTINKNANIYKVSMQDKLDDKMCQAILGE